MGIHADGCLMNQAERSRSGRKPLPPESKRRMYSTRLHPDVIALLHTLKQEKEKPIARIIEGLIKSEGKRLGL